jgi:hypothetical protein
LGSVGTAGSWKGGSFWGKSGKKFFQASNGENPGGNGDWGNGRGCGR